MFDRKILEGVAKSDYLFRNSTFLAPGPIIANSIWYSASIVLAGVDMVKS